MPAPPWAKAWVVITMKRLAADPGKGAIWGLSLVACGAWTWTSYARWANFEYRTFDLAYYVQALWQLIHGRFQLSVEGVPLLGNHVEPIVLLITPIFLIFRHPLIFVVVQNAALASMGPVAFSIGRRLGLDPKAALLVASAILITPATSYIAIHEFHPEAFTAPFLLLLIRARLRGWLRAHWGWLVAVLACKENMALLLVAYCGVHVLLERKRPLAELRAWYLWPMGLSILWFFLCTRWITPALNPGSIDYLALYDRLGSSAGDILVNAFTRPQRILGALLHSLSQGNLVWALLLPFLALPCLRPRWLVIATPILLQHLLSWRSSEWTIYFHYAAPLLPLFWMGLAESTAKIDRWPAVPARIQGSLPWLVAAACLGAQAFLGPARDIAATAMNWFPQEQARARKQAFIRQIPPETSVLAPLPYLSHLAMREELHSLHYVLKGLKTLSRSAYSPPPPTEFVLVDYEDSATFDPIAGYYHPTMKTVDGRVIPSSDRLLHEFLRRSPWTVRASDELTLLQQAKTAGEPLPVPSNAGGPIEITTGATLTGISKSSDALTEQGLEIRMNWAFQDREVFPWMFLRLTPRDERHGIIISRGLCAPEATAGPYHEIWRVDGSERIPAGDYSVEVFFVDNTRRVWATKSGNLDLQSTLLSAPIRLGELKVAPGKSPTSRR